MILYEGLYYLLKLMQIATVRRWYVKLRTLLRLLLLLLLSWPIFWQGLPYFERPPSQGVQMQIAPGAVYQRIVLKHPRPVVMHLAKVDLTQPGLKLLVTPGEVGDDDRELRAQTTTEFLTRYKQQLAINASFFYPFAEDAPWDYYPQAHERVSAVGYTAANGKVYSDGGHVPTWSVVCGHVQNQMQILRQPNCPADTWQGLSGNQLILLNGQPQELPQQGKAYAWTIVATNAAGTMLWLIVVDGKQPWYSEGMTFAELIPVLQQQGIEKALNLDGGGSATMARQADHGPKLLNAPIHNKIPMR